MSRILFAWELGGGYGHLGPFRPIAEALLSRGHELTIAAREVKNAAVVFGAMPVRIVQAPVCMKSYAGLEEPPLNYAEILMRYGYLDEPQLRGLVTAWRGLLEIARAEVVVADHAPTALLVARDRGVPRVATGTPFGVPPAVSPTPNMRQWVNVPIERLASSDATVLAATNAGLPPDMRRLGAVHEIFEGAHTLLSGVAELDPYGPRDPDGYLGLDGGRFSSAPVRWPDGDGPRIFAYLAAEYRHIEAAVAALATSGAPCFVYVRDATPALRQKYEGPRLVFSENPVDLGAAAAASDLCVCHSGFGAATNILRAGKPMLLLPMQLENFLLASRIEKLGMAAVVNPEAQPLDIPGALARAMRDPMLGEAARAFAHRHREPAVDTIVERAAGRIEALAQTGGRTG